MNTIKKKEIIHAAITMAVLLSACDSGHPGKEDAHAAHQDSTAMKPGADACLMPISPEDSLKFISTRLEVSGEVERPLTLTVDSLRNMDVVTVDDIRVVCASGALMKETKGNRGVRLRDIIEKAGLRQANHKDRNFYIVARATDNYKATFSWAELFNNPVGDQVYVLFEEGGAPITAQGQMVLISNSDVRTGPRHVYWLSAIDVHRVP